MTSRWIRSLRPPKQPVDPSHALASHWEDERLPDGGHVPVLTVFLAGAECRFTCVFCDLWRNTLEHGTPLGAVAEQLRAVLRDRGPPPDRAAIKLYNASSFFDPLAVPESDDPEIASLTAPFTRVTVECHPRLVGRRAVEFARRLSGRLEVAVGLETVHPTALPRLNKRMTLADFDRAAVQLCEAGIGLRAFVLVAPPYVPAAEAVEWAVRSARYAIDRGATHVSLIPVRGGNGALEALAGQGVFAPATLAQLEEALDATIECAGAVVTVDLWDAQRFAACADCATPRVARLARMNVTGRRETRVRCATCLGT